MFIAPIVDVPNLITYLNRTPNLELYMAWCGSNDGYQKNTCLKEIVACSKYESRGQHNWG